MKNISLLSISTIALLLLGITSAGFFGFKYLADKQYGEYDLTNGKAKFLANCAVCHGNRGLGDGIASGTLTVSPDNIYDELKNPFGLKQELISSVLDGDNGQGGLMPAFQTTLTEKDVNDIFGYIESVNL
ncbi:c-type cytochrome [Photobacterium sanguinicancri]|uniref:c-type cytochrome n=1 Tax=Photobacterium sanguinicancri TaxID=875932 RepID=UPI003D11D6EF